VEEKVRITESEDGPLVVDGQISLVDAQRNEDRYAREGSALSVWDVGGKTVL